MLTSQQIAALKYLIFASKMGNDLSKRIVALLIDHSEGLTIEVRITLHQDDEGSYRPDEIRAAAHGIGGLTSGNCDTHLDELLVLAGTNFKLSKHYGHIGEKGEFDTAGQFPGLSDSKGGIHPENAPVRYTFWLGKGNYSPTAKKIEFSRIALDKIDLKKSGLYPTLENQDGSLNW